jgi:hypothetical protein
MRKEKNIVEEFIIYLKNTLKFVKRIRVKKRKCRINNKKCWLCLFE